MRASHIGPTAVGTLTAVRFYLSSLFFVQLSDLLPERLLQMQHGQAMQFLTPT